MVKGQQGYGFNLHSDKKKRGQFVRAVDPDSPAESSGMRPGDRILQVNFFFFFKYLVIIGSLHLFVVNFGIKTSAPVSLCGKAMFFTGKKKVKSYGILTDRDFYSVLGKGSVRRQEGNSCKSFWI